MDIGIFDVDNHYYETRDCFTRHIEPGMREHAIHVREENGRDRLFIGDKSCPWMDGIFGFDRTARPGSLAAQLRAEFSEEYVDVEEAIQPAYRERDARLGLMDRQGLERAFLFPSAGVCVEPYLMHDAAKTYANLRAFNRWLDEDWGFAYQDRLFAAPLLSLLDRDEAVLEVERVLACGARVVCLKPGPVAGRSPADPYFDPVWSRLEEARCVVAFHSGNAGYTEMLSPYWGDEASPAAHRMSALQWVTCFADRPIMDTLAALVFGNLFGRFPGLHVLSVENGSLWVPYLVKTLDRMVGMARNGPWIGGRISDRPSRLFRRNIWVSPFPEDDPQPLVDALGVERVVFGSDFPHPEGLAEPSSYALRIEGFEATAQRRILRDNALELLGVRPGAA